MHQGLGFGIWGLTLITGHRMYTAQTNMEPRKDQESKRIQSTVLLTGDDMGFHVTFGGVYAMNSDAAG